MRSQLLSFQLHRQRPHRRRIISGRTARRRCIPADAACFKRNKTSNKR